MDAPAPRPVMTNENYIDQLKKTADKFLSDNASRGDIKMVVTAVKELRYALKVFAPFRHRDKVTIFGSARIAPDHPSYEQAIELSSKLAAANYMVVTGAANGIMEAGHVGAGKEQSIGVNILLPFEQRSNEIIHGDEKLVHLKYFFTRKLMLVKESHAVACFPGGFGTHDELFEILTLMQTGKAALIPVVLVEEPNGNASSPRCCCLVAISRRGTCPFTRSPRMSMKRCIPSPTSTVFITACVTWAIT
jgi:uncharacterized protein (TIGR00730 family)